MTDVSASHLADPAERMKLWNGGADAIAQSDDPFIVLARSLDEGARNLRQRFDAGVRAVEREAAKRIAPFTDIQGLSDRATGSAPFALAPSWLAAQPRPSLAQRLNFVTTNDSIGGSSGRPMLNRQGEPVGLLFDGNLALLGGAFSYDERVNRSVGVHAGAIVEALRNVYAGQALLSELLGAP